MKTQTFTRLASAQPADAKAAKAEKMQLTAIVATCGDVQGDPHRLMPGCWGPGDRGYRDFLRRGSMPVGHDTSDVAHMKCVALRVMSDGALVATIEFADTPRGRELYQLFRDGFMSAFSVGYSVDDATAAKEPDRARRGGLDIYRATLYEISAVIVPADENALVVGRSAKRDTDKARVYAAAREAMSFKSLGEQLQAIVRAAGGVEDNRLQRAPLGAGEIDPSTGGFLVAPQFANKLVGSIYEQSVIAPLVSRVTSDGPLASMKVPAVDETSRADGSRWGGATSYWAAEAATVSASFPRFRNIEFSAKKLIALTYASSELFEDVALLESHLMRALASELSFKLDAAIFSGSAGQPLGVLNSPATIVVPKVAAQAAGTILQDNINAMWSRLAAPCRRNAVWLVNEDAMSQIDAAAGAGTFTGIFAPAGSSGDPTPRLKGRPFYEIEQASALGQVGDIVLIDPTQYMLVGSEMKTAISADVQFLTDQVVFRFTMRVDGAPLWASPVTPFNGTSTRSPFVTLAAR